MSILRPALALHLAELPGFVDPAAAFTRATTGTTIDRLGVMRTAPAGAPRWRHHPVSGVPQGVLCEAAATNLLLRSAELDHASHTKTSASISANSATAPDGTAAADTLTISGASGNASQAVTITAGNAITLSWYFKQLTSSHAVLRLSDGTTTVSAWFNLAAGTVGTASAGAANVVYSAHSMEALADGWYRCQLTVTTTTVTAITCRVSCAAADNVEPANADSVYLWGGQAESPGTASAATSYIATAGSTVTRNGDVLLVPTASSWFSATEGTMLLEWVDRVGAGSSRVLGGIGDSFSNTIYLTRNATQVICTAISGGFNQALMIASLTEADGSIMRAAVAWKANDFALTVNGATPLTDSSAAVPASIARIGVGNAPWSASGGAQPGVPMRRCLYWPRRLSNAALQTLAQQ
jgi:hypothetical protein